MVSWQAVAKAGRRCQCRSARAFLGFSGVARGAVSWIELLVQARIQLKARFEWWSALALEKAYRCAGSPDLIIARELKRWASLNHHPLNAKQPTLPRIGSRKHWHHERPWKTFAPAVKHSSKMERSPVVSWKRLTTLLPVIRGASSPPTWHASTTNSKRGWRWEGRSWRRSSRRNRPWKTPSPLHYGVLS